MDRKVRKSDAYESRCFGLMSKVAFKSNFRSFAIAKDSIKDNGPFYCRECLSEAIVKKCSDKDDHFAHKARLSPNSNGNTTFHHKVRDELLTILKERFPEGAWKIESPMNDANGASVFIPDASGYFGKRSKESIAVAVEVQCSPYSPSYIRKKTLAYAKKGVKVIWIVPLTKELGEEEFRPRRYELFLHSMYLGYVFYYLPKSNGLLIPVHFAPAFRYIKPKDYFDKEVNESVSTEGYYLKYKTLKKPLPSEKVAIYDLIPNILPAWKNPNNSKLDLPERQVLVLNKAQWWIKDERKEWLKNNDLYQFYRENEFYNPHDENDILPNEDS